MGTLFRIRAPRAVRVNVADQATSTFVDLSAGKIANQSSSPSGDIRMELWASPTSYAGGTITGYILGIAIWPPAAAVW